MFKRDWFMTYDIRRQPKINTMNRYIFVDTASAKKKGSDYSVMWVVGLGQDKNYYVLDGVRDHLNLTERTDAIFRLVKKWQPSQVYWETIGAQADAEHVMEEMSIRGYRFSIRQLHQSVPKLDRIRWLEPVFQNSRIWFPSQMFYRDVQGVEHDLTQEFINDEFVIFPATRHDDMLDCLANIKHPNIIGNLIFPKTREYEDEVSRQGRSLHSYSKARSKSVLHR